MASAEGRRAFSANPTVYYLIRLLSGFPPGARPGARMPSASAGGGSDWEKSIEAFRGKLPGRLPTGKPPGHGPGLPRLPANRDPSRLSATEALQESVPRSSPEIAPRRTKARQFALVTPSGRSGSVAPSRACNSRRRQTGPARFAAIRGPTAELAASPATRPCRRSPCARIRL